MSIRASAALAGICVFACHPRPTPATAHEPEHCKGGAAEAPRLAPAPELEPPVSRVTVLASISEQRLTRELSAEVPEVLGSGQENVGAPGRVSYFVRRGPLEAKLVDDRLQVTTRVSVTAQVCKPLGPFCPVYGRCSPQIGAQAAVPLLLTEDYEVAPSAVSVRMLEGCVVAGYDATGEVRREAERAAAEARAQIARATPRLRPGVEVGWAELHRAIPLSDDACVRIRPESLVQAAPTQADGVFQGGATVTGRLSFERPCAASDPTTSAPLPPLATRAVVEPGIELSMLVVVPWREVTDAVAAAVGVLGATTERGVTSRGALIQGTPRVALELPPKRGRCAARVWAAAEPFFDPTSRAIRLRDVESLPGAGRHTGPEPEQAKAIEQSVSVALPLDLRELERTLETTVAALLPPLPADVTAAIELDAPHVGAVTAAPDGLVATVVVTGTASVRAQ